MNFKKYPQRELGHILSIPFIWGMLFFFIAFDVALEIYHQICFRLYKIPLVNRKKYVKIDRHKLKYLSFLDKMRCVYCGYGNGILAYAVKVTGETEKYWCGIKHEKDKKFAEPKHQKNFAEFGDNADFEQKYLKEKND